MPVWSESQTELPARRENKTCGWCLCESVSAILKPPDPGGVSEAARGAPGFGFDPDVLDLNFCAVAGKRAQSRAGGWCHPRISAAGAGELEWRGRARAGGGRLLP